MSKNTGGPAFPFWSDSDGLAQYSGMTLRDYFAAKALQGMLAGFPDADGAHYPALAKLAYAIADEMLKAREA